MNKIKMASFLISQSQTLFKTMEMNLLYHNTRKAWAKTGRKQIANISMHANFFANYKYVTAKNRHTYWCPNGSATNHVISSSIWSFKML